jgi:hypothetical protein
MCSSEERDKRIREMMMKKTEKKIERMNTVISKIIPTVQSPIQSEIVQSPPKKNSYGITDPNICPQIAEGEEYVQSLSADCKHAIRRYTGCGFITVNGVLRRQSPRLSDDFVGILSGLDKAFKNAPELTYPMTVYRGIRKMSELRDAIGFSSCSLSEQTAHMFAGLGGVVFKITIPVGSRVLFVNSISTCRGEDEVIVDRCGSFRNIIDGHLVYVSQLEEI